MFNNWKDRIVHLCGGLTRGEARAYAFAAACRAIRDSKPRIVPATVTCPIHSIREAIPHAESCPLPESSLLSVGG